MPLLAMSRNKYGGTPNTPKKKLRIELLPCNTSVQLTKNLTLTVLYRKVGLGKSSMPD